MPVDNSPSYSCTQRNVFNFFSILESNRLGLPILLITVQSPSLHFFSRVLTVVLIKEYFGYLVVNFLIAEAGPKSLAYRPTSFLILTAISTWYFLGRSYVFCISSSVEASSAEVTFFCHGSWNIGYLNTIGFILTLWLPFKIHQKFFFVHLFFLKLKATA